MTVIGVIDLLWRMRFIIALCGAFVLGCWVIGWWDKTQNLKRERDDLIATNQATMEALDQIKAEKAANEALLKDRATAKAKEADQLGKIIKRITDRDKALDCPVSPAIDDSLDGVF